MLAHGILSQMQYPAEAVAPAGFDPESYGDLYYWWDFTDDSTMSFSGGLTLSSITNKATRTSGNETLNAVVGTPTFVDSDTGTRFDTLDSIANTATSGTGGNLDCLFSGIDATVIIVSKLVTIDTSTQLNDVLWSAAGTGLDDLRLTVVNKTSASGTKCSTDNSPSATYDLIYSFYDYAGGDRYVYRTYDPDVVLPTVDRAMMAMAVDYSASGYSNIGISRNGQAFCGGVPTGNRLNNTGTNKGFVVNARSRSSGLLSPADQYVSHVLIYNGLLDDTAISDLYDNWNASLA